MGVNIKYVVCTILYRHINVPMAFKKVKVSRPSQPKAGLPGKETLYLGGNEWDSNLRRLVHGQMLLTTWPHVTSN